MKNYDASQVTPRMMLNAARRAGNWLASRQTDNGNYLGNQSTDKNGSYPDTDDISCYYKSTYFMRIVGETSSAARLMNYLVHRFMTPDGDFRNSDELRSSGSYVSGFSNLYSNSWAIRSLLAMQWYNLAHKALNFMLRFRSPEGGFYGGVQPPNNIIESTSTGVGCVCSLEAGHLDLAVETGDFILEMLELQPELDKRFYIRMSEGKYVIPKPDEKNINYYRIEINEPMQAYWPGTWPMIALIKLYLRTSQQKFLNGAMRIYDFMDSGHSDAFSSPGAGKNAWASSMLYRIKGEDRYRNNTLRQMAFILSSQHADGFMLQPGAKSFDDQPIRLSYDWTPDFAAWLVECAQELSSRPEQ